MKNNNELWSSPKCSLLHSAHSFKHSFKINVDIKIVKIEGERQDNFMIS